MQPPAGLDNPSTDSKIERQAEEDAVASEETQNALDRAEEENFSNSEPEGDSEPESEFGLQVLVPSNEPEDDDSSSDDSGDSESDGELPLAPPAKAAEHTLQNLTTAEEWKVAEACLPGNKWVNPSATSAAKSHRKRRQNERIEKQKEETIQLNKTYGSITRFFASSESRPQGTGRLRLSFPYNNSTFCQSV